MGGERGAEDLSGRLIAWLGRLPATLLVLAGTLVAVLVAEMVAAITALVLVGHVSTEVWAGALLAPLAVAPLELAVLALVIGRLRAEASGRRAAERDLLAELAARRQAEAELRGNEEKLRAMFERSPLGMVRSSLDGSFLAANAAFLAITGYELGELPDLSFWDVTPFRLAGDQAEDMASLESDGHFGPIEREYIRKDGSRIGVRVAGALITGSGGERYVWSIIEAIATPTCDDAVLAARTEQLARSNADLEQFAFIASHDLREPLRMVTAYMGLLERRFGPELPPEARDYMAFAKEGALRMDRLVLDLLEYSRVGRMDGPLAPVALDRVLDGVMADLAAPLAEAGARVERPHALPELPAIQGEMAQLFLNLLANALKFRHPGRAPRIILGAERAGPNWVISVADNGIGISAEFWERIFRIFQRLHTRDRYEGTGVGLAICKRIAERHGGRIWVESVLGEGTIFRVALPAQ